MAELKNNQHSSKKWKAGFYIRLSREDVESENLNQTIKTYNKAESESITSQRAILMEFITKHSDIEFCDEYVDDGYSGTNFNRPSFKRLIDDVRSGKINSSQCLMLDLCLLLITAIAILNPNPYPI